MLASITLLLAAPVDVPLRAADPPADITGKYDCKGQDADGTEYSGTVEIQKAGDTYTLKWSLTGFGDYVGVGIRTEKVLSVSWLSGINAGVMVYQIQGDGKLAGRWTQLGARGTVQKETLTPSKK